MKRSGPGISTDLPKISINGILTSLLTLWPNGIAPLDNFVKYTKSSVDQTLKRVKQVIVNIIPANETDMEEMKREVWTDLSYVYYKYDVKGQKRAFREVAQEIAEKIAEGKWNNIYQKLYRSENARITF
jgi:hypothetical protein